MSVRPAPAGLRPYLTYSLGLHLGGAALALMLYRGVTAKPAAVYMIDFVGPSALIIDSAGLAQPGKPAAAPAPQSEAAEFATRRHRSAPLPRPSLLRGWHEKRAPAAPQRAAAPASAARSSPGNGAQAGTPGQAGVATDLPNFPYPWYISQIRQILWNQWSARMPKDTGECVVVFTLLRNGGIVDLRTEESAGDSAFDLTALSAVQDGAPYPPLPRGFQDPFLKIHVTLKTL